MLVRNQFDGSSNGHPEEAKGNADEPLELGERCGVDKISQELDEVELEDDGATEDAHENGVLWKKKAVHKTTTTYYKILQSKEGSPQDYNHILQNTSEQPEKNRS